MTVRREAAQHLVLDDLICELVVKVVAALKFDFMSLKFDVLDLNTVCERDEAHARLTCINEILILI